ncbi:hypothetical protein JZ751_000082 [Albula glossodonta]|uniref:coproporphyrinogen oxidase n=1 Tax=Albula glossodonta TaxID=121402 RepID=A0A8T2PVB3_9TELE|nr:hypothetical protein JZ751_000082 [Albula glossodonta]
MLSDKQITSFFENYIPSDFSSRTCDYANRALTFFAQVQQKVCKELQKIDGAEFKMDPWKNTEGGGGVTAVLVEGNVFEKANVDISIVTGKVPMAGLKQLHKSAKIATSLAETKTFAEDHTLLAVTVSSVIHARSPHIPTYHFNLRLIVMKLADGSEVGWYGGVLDLTPSYLVEKDVTHFHRTLKQACDKHDKSYYQHFKKRCDEYFHIPHRGETRGVGGIFFDNLALEEECFSFVQSCGEAILPAYLPVLKAHAHDTFTDQEMAWKQQRNSRYIEFNLMHDKGMKFGFKMPGFRTESLFLTLPTIARWSHKFEPEPGSREDALMQVLHGPRDWA